MSINILDDENFCYLYLFFFFFQIKMNESSSRNDEIMILEKIFTENISEN